MSVDELSAAFHEVHLRLVKSERFAQELYTTVDHNAQLLDHHVDKLKTSEQVSAVYLGHQVRPAGGVLDEEAGRYQQGVGVDNDQ